MADSGTVYDFIASPTFRPVSLRYDSSYDRLYRQFEKEGTIHSTIANAPERLRPLPINVWTPSKGWGDYTVHRQGIVAATPHPIPHPPHYFLPAGLRN